MVYVIMSCVYVMMDFKEKIALNKCVLIIVQAMGNVMETLNGDANAMKDISG